MNVIYFLKRTDDTGSDAGEARVHPQQGDLQLGMYNMHAIL